MTRPLHSLTSAALDKPELPLAVIVYLDIESDPLLCWSGIGDLSFSANETGDSLLDGKTFLGTGTLIEISSVSEGAGGSDVLSITLPGVDITEPMLRQLITNRNRWQFRRAVCWMIALDSDTFAIAGKPFRIKTGRMDAMLYSENLQGGSVSCKIEGQQAYGDSALITRYSEQSDINPNDISQKYVHSLANMTPALGQSSAQNVNASSSATGRFFQSNSFRLG